MKIMANDKTRKLCFMAIRFTGIPFLCREFIQKKKVTIILFHDINRETAEKAFIRLSRIYNLIHLSDFIEAVYRRDNSMIPRKALIITLDDGHIRNYEMLPVIKQHNIPVSIFLCASIINTNRHFWFMFKNRSISVSRLKRVSNKERLALLSQHGFEQDKEFDTPQALQRTHIDEMKHLIDIQSHGLFHAVLPKCTEDEARDEIFDSKEILERHYGLRIDAISYPNGDYSERDIYLAKAAGYKCGITVDFGYNTINTDAFRLKRICLDDNDDVNALIVKASGVWSFIRTINGRKQGFGFTDETQKQ